MCACVYMCVCVCVCARLLMCMNVFVHACVVHSTCEGDKVLYYTS